MFKKILVATDLGDVSKQALSSAARLAGEHKASLYVVNVVFDPMTQPWGVEAYGIDLPQLLENLRRDALAEVTRLVSDIKPPLPIVQTEVLVGAPATEIVRYAREQAVDLIVVGTHGRGPVGRAFLGSVAERVVREAPCPVMIVRSKSVRARRVPHAA
jgi:nucleotide-binding universal stress UspA family protein